MTSCPITEVRRWYINMKKRILIVEDDAAIAQDIAFNLEDKGFVIADIVYTSDKALEALYRLTIDLVVLDIHIKGSKNGIEVARIINEWYRIPFVYLTSYSDPETVLAASLTYPYGYLVKPFKENDLAPAIVTALAKHNVDRGTGYPSIETLNNLATVAFTKTEYTILKNIIDGQTNQQIAEANFVSINTVKTHINNIFNKMGVHSKIQLINIVKK